MNQVPVAEAGERDQIARTVAAIFDQILGRVGSGPDDGFFHLGGDSLAGMRMVTRLHQELGVNIHVADLYQRSTPATLADRVIELRARPETWRRSPASSARRRRGEPFPLALAQEGFFAIEQVTKGAGFFNSVLLIQFTGDVDPDALTDAVGDLVRRQTQLRVVFCTDDGVPGQRIIEDPPEVNRLDLRARGAKALRRLTQMEYLRGFDIHARPPIRFTLARTADDVWSLVVAVHHIIFDAMSQELMLDELANAYRCRLGQGEQRPPLRLDYFDFAEWQRGVLTGERLEHHLDGLRDILRAPSPRIAPQPSGGQLTARMDDFVISAETVAGLDRLAVEHGSTTFVVLLAALADFAQRRTGVGRQVFTIQTANRGRPGTEHVIGCFANMLCVGVDVVPGAPPGEAIAAVRDSLTQAFLHEELPFDYAVSALEERGLNLVETGRMPQLGFTVQQLADEEVALPGCVMTARAVLQEDENVDPTSFPLVVELGATDNGLEGKIHHLVDMWPGSTFDEARNDLIAAFERAAGHAGQA